jgi:hypothetical protein
MLTLEMINGNMVGGECRLGKNDVFVCLNTYVLNFRVIYIYMFGPSAYGFVYHL